MADAVKLALLCHARLHLRGLEACLRSNSVNEISFSTQSEDSLKSFCKSHTVDVVLLNALPPYNINSKLVFELKNLNREIEVICFSPEDNNSFIRYYKAAGARAFVSRDSECEELNAAIELVCNRKEYYSPRLQPVRKRLLAEPDLNNDEVEMLRLVCEGKTNKDIAEVLCLSKRTVENRRLKLMEKISCRNVADMVRFAIREGVINPY